MLRPGSAIKRKVKAPQSTIEKQQNVTTRASSLTSSFVYSKSR